MHLRSGATSSSSPTNRDQGWGLLHAAGALVADLIAAQFAKLDEGPAQLNPLLEPGSYAFGGRLSTADLWLTPVLGRVRREMTDGLVDFMKARSEAANS
jgi:glutathione S-transferase